MQIHTTSQASPPTDDATTRQAPQAPSSRAGLALHSEGALFERLLFGAPTQPATEPSTVLGDKPLASERPLAMAVAGLGARALPPATSQTLFTQVVQQLGQALATANHAMNNGPTTFSLLLPGQVPLNVSMQAHNNGMRTLQLTTENKTFKDWLQQRTQALQSAMSKATGNPVQLHVGATGA